MIVGSRRRVQHGLTALAATSALFLGGVSLAGGAQAAPPTFEPDPNSAGAVTLYDASGVQVTSGSTTSHPFAAYLAGSGPAIAGSPANANAQGYAATPQDGVNSQLWGNDSLTASTPFGTAASANYPGALKNSPNAIAKGTSTDFSLDDYISEFPAASTANPDVYQIRVYTGRPSRYYTMDVKVSGTTWTQVYPAAASTTSTSTSVNAAPPSPSTVGDNVTFTATVTPTAAAGTVQFKDGTTNLGTAQTVTSGSASYSTTALTAGSHSITAVFTPTDTATYSGSTSPAITYVVNAKPVTATTTALDVTPTSPAAANTLETLTATITPTAAAGTVQFKDGTTAIGSPATVTNGKASVNATLKSGAHSLTATFTPNDPATYSASTSTAAAYTVNDPARPTTTALGASPASPQQAGTSVTFTATLTPNTATGTVQFLDGTTPLGSPVTVVNGSAQYPTTALTKGVHAIRAAFTPTDSTLFSASSSTALNYAIATFPGTPANIIASAGNQTATVAWTAPTDNGGTPITGYDLQVSTDGTTYRTAAPGGTRVSTGTSKVVTGLVNGTGYFFRVAAINGIGAGAYRPTTAKVTPLADSTVLSVGAPRSVNQASAATVSTVVSNARTHGRVAGLPVTLYRRAAGQRSFSYVRTVTTSASGLATVRLAVSTNTSFYWHFAGNAAQKAANSPGANVRVTPKVSIGAIDKRIKHGKKLKLYGGATPQQSGERVYLQRLLKGKWRTEFSTTIHRQKLPNGRTATGYVFFRKLQKKGTYTLRVVTAATAYSLAGTSGRLTARAT